jgi:cytochrome oxidase Cu insertion factor (SCO1/SenC/PrrC family)
MFGKNDFKKISAMSQTNKIITILIFVLLPVLVYPTSLIKKNNSTGSKKRQKSVYLAGHYNDGVKHSDSLKISLWKDLFTTNNSKYIPHRTFATAIRNGNFQIKIDSVDNVSYISLSDFNDKWGNAGAFLNFYLVEPGDAVQLDISEAAVVNPLKLQTESGDSICMNCVNVRFSGKGADKYNCRFKMDRALANSMEIYNAEETKREFEKIKAYEHSGLKTPVSTLVEESKNLQKGVDYLEKIPLKTLASYKNRLNNNIYQILKANLIGEIQGQDYARPMSIMTPFRASSLDIYKKWYTSIYYKNTYGVSDAIALKSVYYLDFLIAKSQLENYLYHFNFSGQLPNTEKYQLRIVSTYHFIKSKYVGLLKDKLLLSYLINYSSFVRDPSVLMQDGLNTIKTKENWDFLSAVAVTSQVGKKAYNFSLPDSNDNNVTLDQYKGKVVFIDFWFSGCNGCAEYYSEVVSKVEQHYRNNDRIVFISISLDANKNNWQKSVLRNLYTSTDVINLYKASTSPVVKQFFVSACPHPLLIDSEGRIFSNSNTELRVNGVTGLEDKINQALALKHSVIK